MQSENATTTDWNSIISELQSDCGKLMKLILDMLGRNSSEMNDQATVNFLTTTVCDLSVFDGRLSTISVPLINTRKS